MPQDHNSHQTVTRFGCVGFSMYACGFSVPQMRQFCLFINTPRSQCVSSEKIKIFFAKISIFCKSIAGPLPSIVQAYTRPYQFIGRIKLIICQIRHDLSVTIHEISSSRKKRQMADPIYIYILYVSTMFCILIFIEDICILVNEEMVYIELNITLRLLMYKFNLHKHYSYYLNTSEIHTYVYKF